MNDLGLERFLQAARLGMLVWVRDADGGLAVMSGDRPDPDASPELCALLVAALREHYGVPASRVAEKEFGLGERRQHALPARTIRRAVECAESALSMLMASATMLRFEFSAEYLGRRFRQLCWELSIDPSGLGVERRRAMDEAVLDCFGGVGPTPIDTVRQRLTLLLTQPLH